LQRIYKAKQNVVAAAEPAGSLESSNVARVFHYTQDGGFALCVRTNTAELCIGQVETTLAKAHFLFRFNNGTR
jgi:hypothetical protein